MYRQLCFYALFSVYIYYLFDTGSQVRKTSLQILCSYEKVQFVCDVLFDGIVYIL